MRANPGSEEMRRIVLTLGSLVLCCLAAGCDKCGDPVKFNVPGLPNACYDGPHQKEAIAALSGGEQGVLRTSQAGWSSRILAAEGQP